MKHAIDILTCELDNATEAESRKIKSLDDIQRRYDEMCAKHARELKPVADSLAANKRELAYLQSVKADCQAAKNMLEGKTE